MITGAHSIIYSRDPKKDREFFKKILKLSSVDVGNGWLIFGLPPAEVAVHPGDKNNIHEFYLLCDDIEKFCASMVKAKVVCGTVRNQGWGLMTEITLPGGGRLGVYQPRHKRPKPVKAKSKSIPKRKARS